MSKFGLKNYLFCALAAVIFSACSTPQHQALRKVDVGMLKADVLDLVGNPTRKSRAHGHDRWTYETSGSDSTYVFFQDGKVTYVGSGEPTASTADKKESTTKNSSKFTPIGE